MIRSRLSRISALAGAAALALVGLLPGTAAATATWNYSCQTVSLDFLYNGSGYSSYGETIHFVATGCWNASQTAATSVSPTVTRSWQTDGTFYRDGSSTTGSSLHAGWSEFRADYHVSVWYTSPCQAPFLCIDYNGKWGMYPRLDIAPINQPGVSSWSIVNSCRFIGGVTWVSNCSYSLANLSMGPISTYWISGPGF